ncbi:MAG: tetratricopeptide repeat protein [Pseudanabaenaceae cyanobacterium]
MTALWLAVWLWLGWMVMPGLGAEVPVPPKYQGIPLTCYEEVSNKFAQGNGRVFALSEIASKYIEAKDNDRAVELLNQALELLKDSEDNSQKAYLMVEIADRYTKAGQKQQAEATLNKAYTLVKGFTNQTDRAFAAVKIARAYADYGDKDKASRLLQQAFVPTKDIRDVYAKSRAYAAIASAFISIGDPASANSALEQAQNYAGMSLDPNARARALIEIAGTYAELKDHAQAIKYLQSAFQQLEGEIPDEYKGDFSARAFAFITERYLATDQPEQAKAVLSNIPDQSLEKGIGLLNLSTRYRKDNQLEQAKTTIADSLAKITALPDSLDKAAVLSEIAEGYRLLGDQKSAKEAVSASAAVVAKLTNPAEKIYALNALASQAADRNEQSEAKQYLDQSLAVVGETDKNKPLNNRDRAVSDIAGLYWQIGETDTASRVAESLSPGLEKDQLTALFACANK